jgi:hypothetical protein
VSLQANIKASRIPPLNQRTIKGAIGGAIQYIQDEKIVISRTTLTKLQYAGRWPAEYLSYHTSENRQNLYRSPDKFFRVMHASPKKYKKKFIFRPIADEVTDVKRATLDAMDIIEKKTREYIAATNTPKHPGGKPRPSESTGLYASQFKVRIDGKLIRSFAELDEIDADSVVSIYNSLPYAARSEAIAVEYAKTMGIIYFAAKTISKSSLYPNIGVRFRFRKPAEVPDVISFDGRVYNVPTLEIGSRRSVSPELSRPGKKVRSRRRKNRAK